MKNYMRKYLVICLALFCLSLQGLSQQKVFTGIVSDKNGNPVVDAKVMVKGSIKSVFTDNNGSFNVIGEQGQVIEIVTGDGFKKNVTLDDDEISIVICEEDVLIPIGQGFTKTKRELTGAIDFVSGRELSKISVYNPENSLYGQLSGLTVLQNGGVNWDNSPDMYIRGVETFGIGNFNNRNILVLIDGFEGLLSSLSMQEIENATVLKDAAALALYGLRGANGVLLVTTKKGSTNGLSVNVDYQHGITKAFRLPEFLDGYGYASAYNQALINEGGSAQYTTTELNRFRDGSSPYLYPNTDWLSVGLRDQGVVNRFSVSFQDASKAVRYYGLFNYYDEKGLLDPVDENDGYSTLLDNYRVNIRTNVEVDVTNTTLLTARVAATFGESNRPNDGDGNDVIAALYSTPSAAYPVYSYNNVVSGSQAFPVNPYALISQNGYRKDGRNELMFDIGLNQKLDFLIKGLSVRASIAFINSFSYNDNRRKTYAYESITPIVDASGTIVDTTETLYGTDTELSFSTGVTSLYRRTSSLSGFDHTISWGSGNTLNSSVMFHSEQLVLMNCNNTYRRLMLAGLSSYSKSDKYFVDLAWSYAGTNMLPKNSRWGFFPAISAAWVLSNESFFRNNNALTFLKMRVSSGLVGSDQLIQNIAINPYISSGSYRFGRNNGTLSYGIAEGRPGASPLTYETSFKNNVGFDVTFFNMISFSLDAFYNKRSGILVSTAGSISSVLGLKAAYSSVGKTKNTGFEAKLGINKQIGDFNFKVNANVARAKNEIVEMLEEYKPHDYLKLTGCTIGQSFGLEAIGFFKNEADIAASPTQKFSIIAPGDIKYKDQNNDGIINDYDKIAIGYSSIIPEIYYSFNLGVEFKGIGVEALFQGTKNQTTYLNTASIFWPLRGNNNISTFSDDAWTAATASTATLPRLTTTENVNNYRPNSIWYADASYFKLRNVQLYYNLPKQLISKIKIDGCQVFLRGSNLFSIDDIGIVDPEDIGQVYPTQSSYTIGISVIF